MPTGSLDRGSIAESSDGGEGFGLHVPTPGVTEDPPLDSLTYGVSSQETKLPPLTETFIVGGGFMILHDEPVIAPYERPGHVCTSDCPNPWQQGRLNIAVRALLHDGVHRTVSVIGAELGSTPWGSPGYAYEDVVRVVRDGLATGWLLPAAAEADGEPLLFLADAPRHDESEG